jgi:hypothetical protein
MDLWNDGTGTRDEGNYEGASTIHPNFFHNVEHRGAKVMGHPRVRPVWVLISKMLKEMGYEA